MKKDDESNTKDYLSRNLIRIADYLDGQTVPLSKAQAQAMLDGRLEIVRSRPKKVYLVGSLRNERIPILGNKLRKECPGVEIFEDWYAAGEEADDKWKDYERGRGRTYQEALEGYAAGHVFEFDKHHLDTCTHCLLVLPAGKSGHIELTYAKYGRGAKAAVLLDPADDVRFDVMYKFFDKVLESDEEAINWIGE